MTKIPTFSECAKLRDACAERCAEFGDPPCHELENRTRNSRFNDVMEPIKPCGECLRDIGIEPGDEFDANAAVRLLL